MKAAIIVMSDTDAIALNLNTGIPVLILKFQNCYAIGEIIGYVHVDFFFKVRSPQLELKHEIKLLNNR
jgi:hypothetical protein